MSPLPYKGLQAHLCHCDALLGLRGLLQPGTLVLHMNQLFSTLQSQLPLLAVLGLVDVDELAEESSLTAVLGDELGTLLIGFLEAETVALVVAGETFVTPGGNLVHRDDAGLVEGLAGVFLHFLVVLAVEGGLAESQVAGGGALLGQIFLLEFQGLEVALLSETIVARLLADGAEGKGGEVHGDVALVRLGLMVDVMGELDALLAVDILEHIDSLIGARTIVGLLIWRELSSFLDLLDGFEVVFSLAGTVGAVSLVGQCLELRGQGLFRPKACSSCHQHQKREDYQTGFFFHNCYFDNISRSSFIPSEAPFWICCTREPALMGLGSMR